MSHTQSMEELQKPHISIDTTSIYDNERQVNDNPGFLSVEPKTPTANAFINTNTNQVSPKQNHNNNSSSNSLGLTHGLFRSPSTWRSRLSSLHYKTRQANLTPITKPKKKGPTSPRSPSPGPNKWATMDEQVSPGPEDSLMDEMDNEDPEFWAEKARETITMCHGAINHMKSRPKVRSKMVVVNEGEDDDEDEEEEEEWEFGEYKGISKVEEEMLQGAIELYEHGKYDSAAVKLEYIAKQNHPLSLVLYGLCLRHGWGVRANPLRGAELLAHAAGVSAAGQRYLEGECALALYELGNSFQQGWGVAKEPRMAQRLFEVGAHLGDADAMREAGHIYLGLADRSFGRRHRVRKRVAAQYLRRAAQKDSLTEVGFSWIWKDKYN